MKSYSILPALQQIWAEAGKSQLSRCEDFFASNKFQTYTEQWTTHMHDTEPFTDYHPLPPPSPTAH